MTLEREFGYLKHFHKGSKADYLPRVYSMHQIELQGKQEKQVFLMALLEWFEDYHEWHFSPGPDGGTVAYIWDMNKGYRFASSSETQAIVGQAAKILCLCYDPVTTSRITPWHHGGGDFVVKGIAGSVDVKLITVRGYEPFSGNVELDPVQALVGFFIESVTKMRLDKWEGMGESTWADGSVLGASILGFLEGVRIKESVRQLSPDVLRRFLETLRSLEPHDVKSLLHLQLDHFRSQDQSDYQAILTHLDDHAGEIVKILQVTTLEHYAK
jgi:hypothetical protein